MAFLNSVQPGAPTYVPIGQPGPPILVQGDVHKPRETKSKILVGLGIVQLVLGCMMFLLNIIAYITWDFIVVYSAAGLWMGIIAVIAGAFGVSGGRKITKCRVVTHLVMSIVASVLVWALFATSIMGAIFDAGPLTGGICRPDGTCVRYHVAGIAINSILAIAAIIEFIIAVIASAWTCKILCNQGQPQGQIVYLTQPMLNPAPVPQVYTQAYPQGAMAPPAYDASYATKQ